MKKYVQFLYPKIMGKIIKLQNMTKSYAYDP